MAEMTETPTRQLRLSHEFPPDLRERLDEYIAAENRRIAPAKLAIRSVVNAAVREFLDKRAAQAAKPRRAA